MVEQSIKDALKNFGLTEKEIEVYLLLTKRGTQKTSQISKELKMNKGLTYRILKNLEKKGVIEVTLESPTRYTTVPFEAVINSYIKSKHEEAKRIEDVKDSLLTDWNKISQKEIDLSLEKFSVIEGKNKIYEKISQMLKRTEKQFSFGLLVSDLLDAERFGVFDNIDNLLENKNVKIVTQISKENLETLNFFKEKVRSSLDLRAVNPNFGLSSFSRVFIKDTDELVLVISDNKSEVSSIQSNVCLFTNCKSIIKAFSGFFEEFWKNSITFEERKKQIETGKTISNMVIINNPELSKQKYEEIFNKSSNDILIVSSSERLETFSNQLKRFLGKHPKKISIKIMVPVIKDNLEVAQNLLQFCEVKHISSTYNETIIIDSKHLFQFKNRELESSLNSMNFFKNAIYTNDIEYIKKTKNMLNDLWLKATTPSKLKIESYFTPTKTSIFSEKENSKFTALKNFRKVITFNIEEDKNPKKITEKDVLTKILRAKTKTGSSKNGRVKFYASTGQAIIHPPPSFNLPDMMLHAFHVDKQSTNGGGDSLVIFLWLQTESGLGFVPVAIVGNKPSQENLRRVFKGTPAGKNLHILNNDKFSVRVHGNTLFAVWTEPIQLYPSNYFLPPCCFSLEGFGKMKTGNLSLVYRSGFKNWMEFNALEALVTFYHPASKYSGPGTDGILFRDYIGEHYIPK